MYQNITFYLRLIMNRFYIFRYTVGLTQDHVIYGEAFIQTIEWLVNRRSSLFVAK